MYTCGAVNDWLDLSHMSVLSLSRLNAHTRESSWVSTKRAHADDEDDEDESGPHTRTSHYQSQLQLLNIWKDAGAYLSGLDLDPSLDSPLARGGRGYGDSPAHGVHKERGCAATRGPRSPRATTKELYALGKLLVYNVRAPHQRTASQRRLLSGMERDYRKGDEERKAFVAQGRWFVLVQHVDVVRH